MTDQIDDLNILKRRFPIIDRIKNDPNIVKSPSVLADWRKALNNAVSLKTQIDLLDYATNGAISRRAEKAVASDKKAAGIPQNQEAEEIWATMICNGGIKVATPARKTDPQKPQTGEIVFPVRSGGPLF